MLKVVDQTCASKLGPIAATYRAGPENIFGTCPTTCSLLPADRPAAQVIDTDYLEALIPAVPRRGFAWTYSHFPPADLPRPEDKATVFNVSTETPEAAVAASAAGMPAVYVAPHTDTQWPRRIHGKRFVRCPAEAVAHVTCRSCGGGKPLCARGDRDYVVVFVAHGSAKRAASDPETAGGCFAYAGFHTQVAWKKTADGVGRMIDDTTVQHWAKTLPPGQVIRHHVAGDIGRPQERIKAVRQTRINGKAA